MKNVEEFVSIIKSEFPDDRLTYQKAIPTFHPESAEDASKLFKLANKYKQKIYITGFGNNIDPIGEPFDSMVSVRNDRLNELLELSAEDFYVRVGSGYPLLELCQGRFRLPPSGNQRASQRKKSLVTAFFTALCRFGRRGAGGGVERRIERA